MQKKRELKEQISARSERVTEGIALLQKQAKIRARFGGKIPRMEREPTGEAILYSIFYRQDDRPMGQAVAVPCLFVQSCSI
ncbi:MAG: hypothetical protein HY644_03960 [Acidobacteria bacterium]|nr:hypothetical protein [Acidobacteriota bacterium]